jgi:HPt (histidine-containing phosphotransfer) domain-containing protein
MEVWESFLKNVRAQIPTIEQAVSDGDAEVVRREAHSIGGGAVNLTADHLAAIASDLEDTAKSDATERVMEKVEILKKEYYRLEDYFNNQ